MRRLVVTALLLALVPASADARHARPWGKFTRGKPSAVVRWPTRPFDVAPVAAAAPVPTVAPAATPVPSVTSTPTPAPTTVPTGNPHSLSVHGTEYAFTLSQKTVAAGDVKVQFDLGSAEDAHELAARGPSTFDFGSQDAGSVASHTVTLTAGTYTLYCPLPQHEDLGMKATLTVR